MQLEDLHEIYQLTRNMDKRKLLKQTPGSIKCLFTLIYLSGTKREEEKSSRRVKNCENSRVSAGNRVSRVQGHQDNSLIILFSGNVLKYRFQILRKFFILLLIELQYRRQYYLQKRLRCSI
jgi:hypothetical protein